jgi:hypothetical protein
MCVPAIANGLDGLGAVCVIQVGGREEVEGTDYHRGFAFVLGSIDLYQSRCGYGAVATEQRVRVFFRVVSSGSSRSVIGYTPAHFVLVDSRVSVVLGPQRTTEKETSKESRLEREGGLAPFYERCIHGAFAHILALGADFGVGALIVAV